MIRSSTLLFACFALNCLGQGADIPLNSSQLSERLANESSRAWAIAEIVRGGSHSVPDLLTWLETAPKYVDRKALTIGLLDAFGEMRAVEAVPFLLKHVSLQRWGDMNTWSRTSEVIRERLPAVNALIRIGAPAFDAMARAYWKASSEERPAIMFAMARIDAREREDFMRNARSLLQFELRQIEESLKGGDVR